MDNHKNCITSVEHFRHELRAVLERAKQNLERDDDLANIALLSGASASRHLLVIGATPDVVNAHLKEEVRHGSYESVVFIALAAVAVNRGNDGGRPLYRAAGQAVDFASISDDAQLAIVVEGSHRDFGCHAAHVEFRREAEHRFSFGKSDCGPLSGGAVADLWPKKKLNS